MVLLRAPIESITSLKDTCIPLPNSFTKSVFCLVVVSALYFGSLYFISFFRFLFILLTKSGIFLPFNLFFKAGVTSVASASALLFKASVLSVDCMFSAALSSPILTLAFPFGTPSSVAKALALCIPLFAIKLGKVPNEGFHFKAISRSLLLA